MPPYPSLPSRFDSACAAYTQESVRRTAQRQSTVREGRRGGGKQLQADTQHQQAAGGICKEEEGIWRGQRGGFLTFPPHLLCFFISRTEAWSSQVYPTSDEAML